MWKDDGEKAYLELPADFNYEECLVYLNRNPNEILHAVNIPEQTITKVVKIAQESILFQLRKEKNQLVVSFPMSIPDKEIRKSIVFYVMEWFDLDRKLDAFYKMADSDPILQNVVKRYKGLRIIGVQDLFEALCWAIIGQQISLHVAYLLKKRFVEAFGESVLWNGKTYWLFPTYERMEGLNTQSLISLKISQKKAEYIIGIAQLMSQGQLSKANLSQQTNLIEMEKELTSIRGIGGWSANYVIMRCLRHPDAFPIADVGLHNALKHVLQLERKPSIQEIEEWSKHWTHWKAYATFFLWRVLME